MKPFLCGIRSRNSFSARKTGSFKVLVTAGTYLFVLLFQQIEIPISI